MSDILIKGMEIPKRCNECRFLEGDDMDGLCHAADRWLDDERFTWYVYEEDDIDTSKPANCPLISVPDHGDLIDRDMVLEKAWDVETFGDAVKYAPTIIPAEEGE